MTQCAERHPHAAYEAPIYRRDAWRCLEEQGHEGEHRCWMAHRWITEGDE